MKRDFIENLLKDKLVDGVEAKEIIDAVMTEAGKDIEKHKADAEKHKAEIDKLKEQLQTATDSLKEFEGVDAEALNAKIKELTDAIAAKDKEFADKLSGMEFDKAIEAAISGAKGKNVKAIKALLDLDALKASKDQSKDIEAAIKSLQESDKYLFEDGEPINHPTGPTGNGGGGDDEAAKALRAAMGLPTEEK